MKIGILMALIAAILSSLKGISRKYVSKDFSSIEIGYMGQVYGVILLFPIAAWRYIQSGVSLTPNLGAAVLISTLLILISVYLSIEALRLADISVTEPLRTSSPLFVALLEPLFLNIKFQSIILLAAFFGSAGAYILVAKNSLLAPIENMRNKGAILSLLSALVLAIYSITQRFGAINMDPVLFIYIIYLTTLIGFWIWRKKESAGNIQLQSYFRKDMFAVGTTTAFGVLAGIIAYSMISASEVTIFKQTSALFGVLIGGKFFREDELLRKMIGASIIIAGVVLVVI